MILIFTEENETINMNWREEEDFSLVHISAKNDDSINEEQEGKIEFILYSNGTFRMDFDNIILTSCSYEGNWWIDDKTQNITAKVEKESSGFFGGFEINKGDLLKMKYSSSAIYLKENLYQITFRKVVQ